MAKTKTTTSKTGEVTRPPIVTVMGHVDHGKTSLLDYIRKSRVAEKEHGGITQHIGAYQVEVKDKEGMKKITFIDTPGHAAFEKMRSRGGQIADVVVLVIAATEGIRPQTKESLKHIKHAEVPFVVALNKTDLPESNPEKVKNELLDEGYVTEDRGGDIIAVEVSAKTGKGIDDLLETILLLAEMEELKADPKQDLEAVVIESHIDPRRGPLASVIVKQGTLSVRDEIYVEGTPAKVKALFGPSGRPVKAATPSDPVLILGLSTAPVVGCVVQGSKESDIATQRNSTSDFKEQGKSVISTWIRADVMGSLEAVMHSLPEGVEVLGSGIGDITENDVMMAKTSDTHVLGFNVSISDPVGHLAEIEGVRVKTFSVIYELLEYLDEQIKRVTDPYFDQEIVGKADILAQFMIDKKKIAGGRVVDGEIVDHIQFDLIRNKRKVGSSRITNLRQGKNDVQKVSNGDEFGALFSPYVDFRPGDTIIAYKPKK